MASVWDRMPKRDDPYRGAFRAEWGMLGRWRFEWHRERMARQAADPNRQLLWRRSQRPDGIRNLIAGFLVIEGVVAFLIGLTLMVTYWPPIQNGMMGNPIGFCGLGIVGASISYMIFVGLGMRLYNLLYPPVTLLPAPKHRVEKARREDEGGQEKS